MWGILIQPCTCLVGEGILTGGVGWSSKEFDMGAQRIFNRKPKEGFFCVTLELDKIKWGNEGEKRETCFKPDSNLHFQLQCTMSGHVPTVQHH